MSERLFDALEVCLEAVRTGADPEGCLSLYPDLAEELRPALEASRAADAFDIPEAKNASRRSHALVMQHLSDIHAQRSFQRSGFGLRFALAGLAVLLAIIFTGSGLFAVSAQSLPGDPLYTVKRSFEDLSVAFVYDPQARAQLEEQYQQRRVDEVKALLVLQRVELVSFQGILDTPSAWAWEVGGVQVLLSDETEITGQPEAGMLVEVAGQTQVEGSVRAHTLRVRLLRLAGEVDEIHTGSWVIEGTRFTVNEQTLLDPEIQVHDQVIALLELEGDDGYTALAVFRLPDSMLEALPPPVRKVETPPAASEGSEREVEFTGTVESIAANRWTIAGKTVVVTNETDIDDGVAIGDLVRVKALEKADGSLTAEKIDRLDDGRDDESEDEGGRGDDDGDQDDEKKGGEEEHEQEESDHDVQEEEDDKSFLEGDEHNKI